MLKANAVLLFFFAVFVVFFVFVVALVLVNGGTVGDGIDTFFNASNRTATGVYHAIRNISMGG